MEVKICGLTKMEELSYLNLNNKRADYAGFVFFEKSKRNISYETAGEMIKELNDIKAVAVTVSPTVEQVRKICDMGFDILQVHKELSVEVLEQTSIPIWYAFNISDSKELSEKRLFLKGLSPKLSKKIRGIVVDSANYGSGHTFNWSKELKGEISDILDDRKFILAGGLNPDNVTIGIDIFDPDIVDVSSGVEGKNGKDQRLVKEFINKAKDRED